MADPKKSKKPTGLTIARNRRTFTVSWKCGTTDYDDGQDAYFYEYYTQPMAHVDYEHHRTIVLPTNTTRNTNLNPSASDTSKTHSINLNNYYPASNAVLYKVSFKVRGNRKKKSGMKSDPTWSAWEDKSFTVEAPYTPVVTEALDPSEDRTTTFSWTCVQSDSNSHIFKDFVWESVLTKNQASPNWNSPDIRHTANGIDPDTGGSDTGSDTVSDAVYSWSIDKSGGSVTISEDSYKVYANTTDTYTRWFRVWSRGPGGRSDPADATTYHVYGTPRAVTKLDVSPILKDTSGNSSLIVSLSWKGVQKYAGQKYQDHPIDYAQVQYCIQSPLVTPSTSGNTFNSTISFNPNEANWVDAPGGTVRDSRQWDAYSFSLDTAIPANKTMFVRVNTVHDRRTTYGSIFEVGNARAFLDPPSLPLIQDVDAEQHRILITRPQNNCGIPNSFVAIYYRSSSKASKEQVVGIVPWGQESGTMIIQCPTWASTDSPGLGVRTIIGGYYPVDSISPTDPTQLTDNFTVGAYWTSNGVTWMPGSIPLPPDLKVSKYAQRPYDTISARWDWKWAEANAAELSWADMKDAWMSTNEPTKYTVSGVHASEWLISDLEPQTWWVRCRLLNETSDGTNYGAYSKVQSVTLSTSPNAPGLSTDTPTIVSGRNFTIYWSYYNEDGTKPDSADIGVATVSNGVVTYPEDDDSSIIHLTKTTYDQKETLNAASLGWAAGTTHYLVVRVYSKSGERSDWSQPLAIQVVPPVTASISGTVINSHVLTSLPFTVNVSGIGTDGMATAVITRRDSYSIVRPELRPDEAPEDGFAGETIAIVSRDGSGAITFNRSDLMGVGRLDDGAYYEIMGMVMDSNGQTAKTKPVEFKVAWSHQALMPEANITIDNEHLAVIIEPTAVNGAVSGDTVDIYRLSVDRPELIVKGATMGETYVDPYPTLGRFGGHRLVYITKDGDYITSSNTLAIENYPDEDFDETSGHINYFGTVIDFGSEQIRLPYNIELSNKWSKDFTEVKYLGGSIQGYWNKAVSRTGTIRTSVVIEEDEVGPETMQALRRLAVWPGVCHVRTPDGSSFAANVNVSEDRENKWVKRLASVTLDITRVDSQKLDGLTYDEWLQTI